MPNPNFILKLSSFVESSWPNIRVGHSLHGVDSEYPCANPDGPVDNSDCPEDDPLCNCPCQELKPSGDASWWDLFGFWGTDELEEPTQEELQEALEEIKECDFIEDAFGSDYLGCLWKDQDHPSSCNCPCVGDKFKDYMEYTRTYATYWDTPNKTPLWRDAQMFLINSQSAQVVLNGDLSLRPGSLIKIVNKIAKNPAGDDDKTRRFSGRWLVASISHVIQNESHRMVVILTRDSSPIEPDESTFGGWLDSIVDWWT